MIGGSTCRSEERKEKEEKRGLRAKAGWAGLLGCLAPGWPSWVIALLFFKKLFFFLFPSWFLLGFGVQFCLNSNVLKNSI
jgi:hypothetical protein